MNLQIPTSELSNYKSRDLIPLKCKHCQQIFYREKHYILAVIKKPERRPIDFCSQKCQGHYKTTNKTQQIQCLNCNKTFSKRNSEIKKSSNHFCSQSCGGSYRQAHKTIGYRRSKLEIYLEENLKLFLPNLNIIFNDRKTIGYELDIYIPSKQLAFELNGIFHYQPIYSNYQRTIEIDQLKPQLCQTHNIQLYVFDVSKLKKFKPEIGDYYLQQIKNIILAGGNAPPSELYKNSVLTFELSEALKNSQGSGI